MTKTLKLNIGKYSQVLNADTMEGDLNVLWDYGNSLRIAKGLNALDMREWCESESTVELINVMRDKLNASQDTQFIKTKRGKGGGTWVHLYLMLDAAAWLDAGFKIERYDTFIKGKLLEWRDESGNNFKLMTSAIDKHLPCLTESNKISAYVQVSNLMQELIKPEGGSWNNATTEQLKVRANLENKLISFLEMGFIRDLKHLKEVMRTVKL